MKNEPLFLPKGSVRAILILTLTGWILACIWYQKDVTQTIITVWAGAIGWYFAGKIDDFKNKENK